MKGRRPLSFGRESKNTNMGKKNEEPDVRQPSLEAQREYASLVGNDVSMVRIRGKAYKMRWLKKGQIAKLGRVLIDKESTDGEKTLGNLEKVVSDGKKACKAAAIYLLDGYWKLKLNYWWLWRWFYYVKQYEDIELREVLEEGKKKVPLQQFLLTTMSLTGAGDTLMMMRTEEAERILRELSSEQPSQEQKSDNG